MFFGQFEHTVDDKSRLTLPARFREALGDGVVLSKGLEGNVDVWPRSSWESAVQARLQQLDPFARETRQMRRHFFAGAADAELDRNGRVLLPPALVEFAHLGKEVVVAGVDDHLEIWDRRLWRDHMSAVEGSAEHVAERLAAQRG